MRRSFLADFSKKERFWISERLFGAFFVSKGREESPSLTV